MSSARAFVDEFKVLHGKAKTRSLKPNERALYDSARDQLSRMAMLAQDRAQTGRTLRSAFRMPKVLKVDLKSAEGETFRASTIDLASSGFAALLPTSPKVGKPFTFALTLPNAPNGGNAPITGDVVVASCRSQGGLFRTTFTFAALGPEAKEQLDLTLIDAVLERFVGM